MSENEKKLEPRDDTKGAKQATAATKTSESSESNRVSLTDFLKENEGEMEAEESSEKEKDKDKLAEQSGAGKMRKLFKVFGRQ